MPITEFTRRRKTRDSLYTKLLSKSETIAARDLRQGPLPHRDAHDGGPLPVLNYLNRRLFPFNYAIPGESYNTCSTARLHQVAPAAPRLLSSPLSNVSADPLTGLVDNKFSARSYRVIHFVVDMPCACRGG